MQSSWILPQQQQVSAALTSTSSSHPENEAVIEKLAPEWMELGVQLMQTSEGTFLLREVIYPHTHRHGIHGMDELQQAAYGLSYFRKPEDRLIKKSYRNVLRDTSSSSANVPENAAQTNLNSLMPAIEPDKVLFLDLETTGLGVGTGNVPFMVGLAYSKDGTFCVEQMLIRHPAEERAMIAYLTQKLPSYYSFGYV